MKNTPNYNLNKPDGNDYAKIESLNANADIIDTELKRISTAIGNGSTGNDILSRLNTLETKVGNLNNLETTQKANLVAAINEVRKSAINAWQKGVYNDTTITNLGKCNVSKTFAITAEDWKSQTNVEFFQVVIPVVNFSGILKVTYATSSAYSQARGGAEVIFNIAKYENAMHYHSKEIVSISPNFAKDYFIRDIYYEQSSITIVLFKAPTARNPMTVKIEAWGTYDTLFQSMKDGYSQIVDTGSATQGGYPWIPQKAVSDTRQLIVAIDKSGEFDGAYPDPNTFLDSAFITNHANAMSPGEPNKFYFIDQLFYGNVSANNARSQFARTYAGTNADFKSRHYHPNEGWTPWTPSIQQLFTSVSEGKADNRAALAQKGVQIPQDPTFAQISQGIMQIKTGRLDSIAVTIPGIPPNGVVSVVVAVDFYPWHAMMNLDGVVLRNGVITGNNWANRFSVYNIRAVFDSGTLWKVYFDIRGGLQGAGEQTNTIFLAPKMD